MDKKFIGIVIGKVSYKEKDNLVSIFSPECGLVLGRLKGVKGAGSKLKILASPFCFAEFTAVETNGHTTITGGEVIDTFFEITKDLGRYYVSSCMLDLDRHLLKFGQDHYSLLFSKLIDGLKNVCYICENEKIALIKFLLDVLTLSGFSLDFKVCSQCGNSISDAFIDIMDNSVKCKNCVSSKSINVEKNIIEAINMINKDIKTATIDEVILIELLKILGNYIYICFDYKIKLEGII